MGDLEQRTFNNDWDKPSIYDHYVDDILMQVSNINQLIEIKDLSKNSEFNFTYELKTNYKPTDHGMCLNANSHSPEKYKCSVIHNYQ